MVEMVVYIAEMVVYMVEMVMGEGFVFGGKGNVSRIDSRCKRTPPAPRSPLTIRLLYHECEDLWCGSEVMARPMAAIDQRACCLRPLFTNF